MVQIIDCTLGFGGSKFDAETVQLVTESIATFKEWEMYYLQMRGSADCSDFGGIDNLTQQVIDLLNEPTVFHVAADCMTDILRTSRAYVSPTSMYKLLSWISSQKNPQGSYFDRLESEHQEDGDAVLFARLLMEFCEANCTEMVRSPLDEEIQNLMSMMCSLQAISGTPGVDNHLAQPALEFWASFIDKVSESVHQNSRTFAVPEGKRNIRIVSDIIWGKMRYPCGDLALWGQEDREAFQFFRREAIDVLTSAFAVLDIDVFNLLIGKILRGLQLEKRDWRVSF